MVALDLPGHGEARGPRGDIPSWTRVRDQIVPLLFTASRGLPGQPLKLPHVLLGHGMGGVMALDYALAHPREILAVVAVAPSLMSVRPKSWKLALAMVGRVVAPSAGFPHGIDEGGMSRDPEVLALRKSDRRVHGRISPRLLFAFEEARRRVMREARQLKVPALLLHGAAAHALELEVHARLPDVHRAAGHRGAVVAPDHAAEDVQGRVGAHQGVAPLPVDLRLHGRAGGRELPAQLDQRRPPDARHH